MRTGALNKLTALQVRNAGEGMHSDGGGLFLRVKGESRTWVFRFTRDGRKREMGLGTLAAVPLARAREKAAAARRLVGEGLDPIEARTPATPAEAARQAPNFATAMDRYLRTNEAVWSNAKHARQWHATLTRHAAALMPVKVDEIGVAEVAAVLAPIWTSKRETASRVRQRIERILGASIALGERGHPNPAALKDNLDHILPKVKRDVRHHAAVPVDTAPRTYAKITERDGAGAACLRLAILCAMRSGEARRLTWSDVKGTMIEVPPERMKARRAHRVPLTPAVAELLEVQPRWARTDLVFPSSRGGVVSDMTLAAVMKRIGIDATPHGWRSTFSDWAHREGWAHELVEDQLAHLVGSDVARAYRRGDFLDRRRPMMLAWNGFLTDFIDGSK